MWIVGLLPSDGSSPVPESVQDAFHSFSDIRNPGSYTATDRRQLPKGDIHKSDAPHFNFTEWWKIGEGDTMGEPFDVCDELVEGLLRVLEMEAGAQLHKKIMEVFKKAQEIYAETDSQVKSLGDLSLWPLKAIRQKEPWDNPVLCSSNVTFFGTSLIPSASLDGPENVTVDSQHQLPSESNSLRSKTPFQNAEDIYRHQISAPFQDLPIISQYITQEAADNLRVVHQEATDDLVVAQSGTSNNVEVA
ncbi:hypothetical protein EI94DRAFT_1705857 [Lactarius quietus]|nr:hypothetical protein EI94DRAFT_1705857 [Lactarius quietus]